MSFAWWSERLDPNDQRPLQPAAAAKAADSDVLAQTSAEAGEERLPLDYLASIIY